MRVTVLEHDDGHVVARELEPEWQPLDEYRGVPFHGISYAVLLEGPGANVLFNRFEEGAEAPTHAALELVVIQVVEGRGVIGLPDGTQVAFEAPQLLVLQPGVEHAWSQVYERTLLSICTVPQA